MSCLGLFFALYTYNRVHIKMNKVRSLHKKTKMSLNFAEFSTLAAAFLLEIQKCAFFGLWMIWSS